MRLARPECRNRGLVGGKVEKLFLDGQVDDAEDEVELRGNFCEEDLSRALLKIFAATSGSIVWCPC